MNVHGKCLCACLSYKPTHARPYRFTSSIGICHAEESVNKTGRLLVSHEAPITSGFGAEVTATITKRCFASLESPPVRICGYDTPFPLVYEPIYMPTAQKIVDAVEQSLKY